MEKASVDEDGNASFFDQEIGSSEDIARLESQVFYPVRFQENRKALFRAPVSGGTDCTHVPAAKF